MTNADRAILADETAAGMGELRPDELAALPFMNASVPNAARIYDYLLGGKNNFESDRVAAEEIRQLIPDAPDACRQNREFLGRVLWFLAGKAGIRHFIDIGAGLPTQGNVHELTEKISPEARVVYVDYDPIVVSHARALHATRPTVAAIAGDLRNPGQILGNPKLRKLIDFGEPVAILLVAVLHFVADNEDPYGAVNSLKSALPPGSYLAVSHITADKVSNDKSRKAREVYDRATAPAVPRSREQIRRFFTELDIVEPGIVDVKAWRNESPQHAPSRTLMYAAVGRKP